MTEVNVTGIADTAEKAVEAVMKVEPMIASGIGMFVPGAAPIVAMVQPWVILSAPYLERALKDISSSNGGDALNAFVELMQHISKGLPSSPALSGTITESDSRSGSG